MRIRLRVLRFRLRVLSFRLRISGLSTCFGVLNLENVFGECEKALLFYIPPLLHWNTASTPATVQALARACPWCLHCCSAAPSSRRRGAYLLRVLDLLIATAVVFGPASRLCCPSVSAPAEQTPGNAAPRRGRSDVRPIANSPRERSAYRVLTLSL